MVAAYRIKADQIVGGPSWIDIDHFDMNAKAERSSNIEELHAMPKNLLKELPRGFTPRAGKGDVFCATPPLDSVVSERVLCEPSPETTIQGVVLSARDFKA
jgi:hypothetical protein